MSGSQGIAQTAAGSDGVRLLVASNGLPSATVGDGTGAVGELAAPELVAAYQRWAFTVTLDHDGEAALTIDGLTAVGHLVHPRPSCRALTVGVPTSGGPSASMIGSVVFQAGRQPAGLPGQPVVEGLGLLLAVWVVAGSVAGRRRPEGSSTP
jgi:hypothetical protein